MKFYLTILFIISSMMPLFSQPLPDRSSLFDFGWKFHRGGAQGAENISFDDSKWRTVDLPHDWSIEDLPGTNTPFNINAISQVSGGFTTGGTGWYRKVFFISAGQKNRNFILLFEGVYMNAEVFLNGQLLGVHPYGYTSFWFDITGKIKTDQDNVLSVKVMNEGENSRWYSGSGIYRHVWLLNLDPVHFETWGTSVATPVIKQEEALISVHNTLINNTGKSEKIRLVTRITDPEGKQAGETETSLTLEPGKNSGLAQEIKIMEPKLWSTESPVLYRAECEIYRGDSRADQISTNFGIRFFSFDTVNGFQLNGRKMKLKGGCVHHDNGPLGSKAFDRAEERRVEILRASGFNAIRSAHNPPSPAFLDACDRLGMLVMDEAFDMWNEGKNPYDYHLWFDNWWKKDIESMVMRDRNHPSVIMWSIGNEIPNRQKPEVVDIEKELAAFVRENDPTRPVTSAVNDLRPDKDPYFAVLDIAGYNYASGGDHNQTDIYGLDHARVPGRIMAGTESYPLEAFRSWMDVIDHPYVIGDFVWTAFDYIGEASIGWRGYFQKQNFFPWNLAFCGDIDICGWKRPQSFYRDALWKPDQLSVWITPPRPSFELNPERESWSKWHWHDAVSDWNWQDLSVGPLEVYVYSSCDQVELFLNGKSLGKKPTNRETEFMASWKVKYQPGTLRAVGYKSRKQTAVYELKTSGDPAELKLSADRQVIHADRQDLCYVTVEVTDSEGILNPKAENSVRFEIEGPGEIIGVGNADPVSLESCISDVRKAWHGRCLAIIRSEREKGKITLRAVSEGLRSGTIEIESK